MDQVKFVEDSLLKKFHLVHSGIFVPSVTVVHVHHTGNICSKCYCCTCASYWEYLFQVLLLYMCIILGLLGLFLCLGGFAKFEQTPVKSNNKEIRPMPQTLFWRSYESVFSHYINVLVSLHLSRPVFSHKTLPYLKLSTHLSNLWNAISVQNKIITICI